MTMTESDAQAELTRLAGLTIAGPITPQMHEQAFRLAFQALAGKDAEIARLKAELDRYEGRDVRHGLERYIQSQLSDGAIAPEKDGTILRATDTGAEWECQDGAWKVREQPKGRHST
jgi:hypothetical protein